MVKGSKEIRIYGISDSRIYGLLEIRNYRNGSRDPLDEKI